MLRGAVSRGTHLESVGMSFTQENDRFDLGKNWESCSKLPDEDRLANAEHRLSS